MITFLGRLFLVHAIEKLSEFRPVELPVERTWVPVGEFFVQVQAFFDLGDTGKIVRGENLPLDLGEVNLHLIQPAGMDRRVNQDAGRVAVGVLPGSIRPPVAPRRGRP